MLAHHAEGSVQPDPDLHRGQLVFIVSRTGVMGSRGWQCGVCGPCCIRPCSHNQILFFGNFLFFFGITTSLAKIVSGRPVFGVTTLHTAKLVWRVGGAAEIATPRIGVT